MAAEIKPALVSIDIRHPEENPSEDDGVEDTHQGDAEHDPERDEGNLPGPGDDAEHRDGGDGAWEELEKAYPLTCRV